MAAVEEPNMSIANAIARDPLPADEWTTEKYRAFAAELDALHAEVSTQLGAEDVAYVKKIRALSWRAEVLAEHCSTSASIR
jgi:hypothetical protein